MMEIQVSTNTSIGSIKEAFAAKWPHLKLVFFTKPHLEHHGTGAKFMIDDNDLTVGQLNPNYTQTTLISVDEQMTVWNLEKLFETAFGLHVHVFRKSGKTWLESTVSDSLTLAQQEAKGAASASGGIYIIDTIDYREQD